MKKKRLIIIIVVILCIVAIITITYKVYSINNKLSMEEKNAEQLDNSEMQIQELTEYLENNSTNNAIIKVDDSMGKEVEIKQSYIDVIKMLEDTEEPEKQAIEYTIYATEAKNMNIQLSNEDIKEIKELSNSEEILKYASNEESKNILKSEIYTYLTNIYYKLELENKIMDEIEHNKLSIDNKDLQQKMNEYISIQNNFKENKNPSEEERKKFLEDLSTKYYEIKNLYMNLIKEKYNVNNL